MPYHNKLLSLEFDVKFEMETGSYRKNFVLCLLTVMGIHPFPIVLFYVVGWSIKFGLHYSWNKNKYNRIFEQDSIKIGELTKIIVNKPLRLSDRNLSWFHPHDTNEDINCAHFSNVNIQFYKSKKLKYLQDILFSWIYSTFWGFN